VTIQDIGSLGEIVGALATVITLAYLAVQIRANTRMMATQSRHRAEEVSSRYTMALAQDPQLADLFRRGLGGTESLTPTEKVQLSFLFGQMLSAAETAFDDFETGVSDRAGFDRHINGVLPLLRSPGGRSYWRDFRERAGYRSSFRSFIDSELSDASDKPDPPAAVQQSAAADSA
jgi:hypothetical protein